MQPVAEFRFRKIDIGGNAMPDRPLIEPVHCPDIFASGIARVERLAGGLVRIVYYVEDHDEAGRAVRVVTAKMLRPISGLHSSAMLALADRPQDNVVQH